MSVPLVMGMKGRGSGPQIPIFHAYKHVMVEGLAFGERADVFFDFERILEVHIDGLYPITHPVPSKAHAVVHGNGGKEVSVWLE